LRIIFAHVQDENIRLLLFTFSDVMVWNKIDNVTHHYLFISNNRGDGSLTGARGGMQIK
jgi:hypothetical protein